MPDTFSNLLRRLAGSCVALALAASTCAAAADPGAARDLDDRSDPALQRGLESVVRGLGLANEVDARHLALALVDLTDASAPRLAMLNGNEMMYAASLPKVAIVFGVFAEVESGRLALDETHIEAMTNMIRYSSNEDASRVLAWVGPERLLEILQSDRYRFYDAAGAGGLWVGKDYTQDEAYRRDPIRRLSHSATAFQVARLYYLLATDALFTPPLNELMKEILSKPGIHHKFVKGLESRPGVRIYRKSGTWKDFHSDSALVEYGHYRYIIVGLAEHPQGGDWLVRLAAPLHDLVVSPPAPAAGR
jgi:beta-lactamase class A